MTPHPSPATGAKKKMKVVRTVRKVVKKPKIPSPAAAVAAAIDDIATTPTAASPPSNTEATPAPDTTPEASEPAAPETPAAVTIPEPSDHAAAAASIPATATEPSDPEPTKEPSEPTDATASSPEPAKPPAEKPKVTRVRKVVVKKIVVRKVPKGTSSVATKNKEEAKAVPSRSQAENPSLTTVATEIPESTEQGNAVSATAGDVVMSEGQQGCRRKKTEVFVGGLDREAKEEDLRKVFGKAGEIVEVRVMMDQKTGKNKGYAFVRYAEEEQAKKAIAEFAKVEVCGKTCGAAALEGNDTIFLGNVDKTWKKEDILKLLQENGIDKINSLTIMPDPHNADLNRGFAFLELETNRDAQLAYKKLQKKAAFGKGLNVKVSWAEPLNDPDKEEMQKVKSVYIDGLPSSWSEDKVRESFKKFGEIERVVLARNIPSAKRKDFAFVNYATRAAAILCVESFVKEGLTDNGSKVNVKISLAKPVQKDKQNKGGSKINNKNNNKEKPKTFENNSKSYLSLNKGKPLHGGQATNSRDKSSSTTHELLHVLREQANWKQEQIGYAEGHIMQDYTHSLYGGKRPFSSLGVDATGDLRGYQRARVDSSLPVPSSSYVLQGVDASGDLRGYQRARVDSSLPVPSSSYVALPHGLSSSSLSYYQSPGVAYPYGTYSAASDHSNTQMRQGGFPYGSNTYH